MSAADGLWLFLTMTFLVLGMLLYDLVLWHFGFNTITDFARRHVWAAVLILVLKFIGLIGLAFHFFGNGEGKL